MDKIIEILEKYSKPQNCIILLTGVVVLQVLLWSTVNDIKAEQIKRTVTIDAINHKLIRSLP